MPFLDTDSPTLTSAEAEAYLRQSIRARVAAVKTISEIEEAKAAEISDQTWENAFELWHTQTRAKNSYQQQIGG